MNEQVITLPKKPNYHIKNFDNKKLIDVINVFAVYKNELCAPICVKLYKSQTGSTWYADIEAQTTNNTFFNGYGRAGGGGYHKPSAALQAAFSKAGLKTKYSFHGGGDRGINEALDALAQACGYRKFIIERS